MVQIVRGEYYRDISERQNAGEDRRIFSRGSIFFETKDHATVAAATVKEGYDLVITPKDIVDPESAYELVAPVIDMSREDFIRKASKTDDPYEEILKHIDRDSGITIAELNVAGVNLVPTAWRFYPGEESASNALGLIGYDRTNTLAGRYGLERFYENTLSRRSLDRSRNFFIEIFSGIQKTISGDSLEGDIVTTIEPTVQRYVDDVAKKTKDRWQSDELGIIVMDPSTGEIRAMSIMPSFNPNKRDEVSDPKVFSNPLVENVYEMGSIIKPLTIASGIDSGAITAKSTYVDEGSINIDGKKISNYDGIGRGRVDIQQILSQSLNTGVAFVASKMGRDDFSRYFFNLGFGDKTGIDQPNEQTGIVENLKSGRDIEHATAAFGQGIAITPMAAVRALATIANDGVLVTPHLVSRIDSSVGISDVLEWPEGKQVFSASSTEEVTRMLVEVVDKALKGGALKNDRYTIAAKTGTAQIADREAGGYYKDRYLHSFFGYFPAYDPRFIVFLYHVYPKGAAFASETLVEPFDDITTFLLNYYQIPPDR
jgi:cell division protein FtsI/penicillin-binding protein 2